MDLVDGKVICLVRAKDDAAARQRLDATFDSGDPKLLRALPRTGRRPPRGARRRQGRGRTSDSTTPTWQRLADTVDLIVDPAALVNHVLPYSQLFGPNVARHRRADPHRADDAGSSRSPTCPRSVSVTRSSPASSSRTPTSGMISPTRKIDDSYANGYGNSKWAGEVLLREAHDLFGLPVSVFRCDMILADTTYAGQLNLPDMFTRHDVVTWWPPGSRRARSTSSTPTATGSAPTTTGCPWISSPRRSPHSVQCGRRVSRPIT